LGKERLYDPRWWEITINKGIPLSFTFNELPTEELMVCDEMGKKYPGLRFNLRKQRGSRYLLTILPSKHLDEEKVKGEP
jgi:hypothetical protein